VTATTWAGEGGKSVGSGHRKENGVSKLWRQTRRKLAGRAAKRRADVGRLDILALAGDNGGQLAAIMAS